MREESSRKCKQKVLFGIFKLSRAVNREQLWPQELKP